MKPHRLSILVLATLLSPAFAADTMSFLDNAQVRVGANLDLGGAITFISSSKNPDNLVNSFDWGRQIQMSYYSGPVPFTAGDKKPHDNWKGLGWNPIQSGDVARHRSKILEHRNDGKSIYIKCIPMHWPLDNVPGECTFECWIELSGPAILVRSRINNDRPDKTQYPGRHQECPAVYTNGPWWKLMTYEGDKPFTNAPLTQRPATMPWTGWHATENFSALVDDKDYGLGIWHPGCHRFGGGFAGKPGQGGPKDNPTGYLTPIFSEILDHNIQHEYRYVLIPGTLAEIRKYVYDHASKPTPPNYVFQSDRQHWTYRNCRDTGWPIQGELNIPLSAKAPRLIGPLDFWPAADAPKLYIQAACKLTKPTATLYWTRFDSPHPSPDKRLTFPLAPDAQYHTYILDLKSSPTYTNIITSLQLDPTSTPSDSDWIKIRSIGFTPPEKLNPTTAPSSFESRH